MKSGPNLEKQQPDSKSKSESRSRKKSITGFNGNRNSKNENKNEIIKENGVSNRQKKILVPEENLKEKHVTIKVRNPNPKYENGF